MKLVIAFFRLIRWPNLVFIAVTQLFFYYFVLQPIFIQYNSTPALTENLFWLVITSSILIAAAGYIINDYFDLNIDRINKPNKLIIEKIIKRRWAIFWHLFLSLIAIVISVGIGFKMDEIYAILVVIINFFCVIALWLYSTTYKRKLLVGNILISVLTSWTIFILYFINIKIWVQTIVPKQQVVDKYEIANTKLFKYTVLYTGFAFIISLIREVIKDMEDIYGDAKYNCKTMPIVWGIPTAKVFTAVWIIVLLGVLIILQFYAIHLSWWWSVLYCATLIIAPLIWVLQKLYQAQVTADFHQLSNVVKLIMLTGILSMLFIKMYI